MLVGTAWGKLLAVDTNVILHGGRLTFPTQDTIKILLLGVF
jgi:hypothetical protein